MSTIDRTMTLGAIAAAHRGAAGLFEHLGMDYCCGGGDTLEHACTERGLDVQTVTLMLGAPPLEPARPSGPHADLAAVSITQLCEHIVASRHGPLHVDLQRIGALLNTVTRVHGAAHPELRALQDRFATLRSDLEAHVRLEEATLFPACRALDGSIRQPFDAPLLVHLEDAHDDVGAGLRELREISGGYDPDHALCATHRTLLAALRAFEQDMHQHVHEENNVLFPKVRARLTAHA